MKKPFAIGRVLSVAALGELLVRPWFRWDGPPGRRQSHKNDTMGVGLAPNCPDRSRCGTSRSGTRPGGDTDRQSASHATLQKPSALRRKEKAFERITWSEPLSQSHAGRGSSVRPLARVTSLRVRCAPHDMSLSHPNNPDGIRTTLLTTLIGVQPLFFDRLAGESPASAMDGWAE